MDLWCIFVLGMLRLNLNIDYDKLKDLADNHRTIRLMLGHSIFDYKKYNLQTLKDNIKLFTPEVLAQINNVVVQAGHDFKNKKGPTKGKCDSFVVETNVHFPTDISLFYDAIRKMIELTAEMCKENDVKGYRQYQNKIRRLKRLARIIARMKKSISKDETKKERKIKNKYKEYIELANEYISEANGYKEILKQECERIESDFVLINEFIKHAERQIDQIERRVFKNEVIPHEEKCFSVFQPHTEWICKGKAGILAELGIKVVIVEDEIGFILHHEVMEKQTDDKVAVPVVQEVKKNFETFSGCSFDKGFYTKENREELNEILEDVIMPKKGRLSQSDEKIETSDVFVKYRKKHSAVESAINALEVHGLDICPDSGIFGFKRYVALAVVARNIQVLGSLVQKKLIKALKRKQKKLKKVA